MLRFLIRSAQRTTFVPKTKQDMNKLFLTILAAAAILSSCSNSGSNDYTVTTAIRDCFESVTAKDGTNTVSGTTVNYSIEINYTKATANVVINGLKLADGTGTPDIQLRDLKVVGTEEGWLKITAPTAIPAATGGRTPAIDNLEINLLIAYNAVYGFCTRFVMDNDYSVLSACNAYSLGATTTTSGAGQPFQTKNTIYSFRLNPSKKCLDLGLSNAQFMDKMPAMNFVLKEIPFTVYDKSVSFNAASLVPYVGNTPNEGFPITDLSGNLDFTKGLHLNFKCSPKTVQGVTFQTSASGTFLDIFTQN